MKKKGGGSTAEGGAERTGKRRRKKRGGKTKARIGEIEDQKTSLAHEDTNHPLEKPKRYLLKSKA